MFSRLFGRWSKSSAFTANELAILRLLLPAGNEYSERLFSQAANAPYVERKVKERNGYEAIIPFVADDSLLIECEENVNSPTISLTTSTGITLNFSTTILRGGFLRGLKGRTEEGAVWSKEWEADLQNARIPNDIRNWIPKPIAEETRNRAIVQLIRWCGFKTKDSESFPNEEIVRVTEPASKMQVRDCESRLQVRLSEQYCQLISITNGFGIKRGRPYELLGTFDLNYAIGGHEWLCLTPLYEEGCVAIRCNEGIASNECYLLSEGGASNHIGDIKQHVRESLRWEDAAM